MTTIMVRVILHQLVHIIIMYFILYTAEKQESDTWTALMAYAFRRWSLA